MTRLKRNLVLACVAACAFGASAETISHTSTKTVSTPLPMTEATTISVADGATVTYDASAVVSGAFALTKTGKGTLVLAAANTFSGGLVVAEGTVRVETAGAQGTGSVSIGTSGLLNLPAGKALDVDGLSVNGRLLPYGTYGGTGSAAGNKKYASHFTGTGYLLNRSQEVEVGFALFFR